MDPADQQVDEAQVLLSIYEGDTNFQQLSASSYQYRVEPDGNANHPKRFLVQINWPPSYPDIGPTINLDVFYNSHLSGSVKRKIVGKLEEEVELWKGSAMTYNLIELGKSSWNDWISDSDIKTNNAQDDDGQREEVQRPVQKETGADSESKVRGWNWVDVIKHLSKTAST